MSLLTNEDFAVYQLRLGYLNNIQDGVGERLITLNSSVLNDPGFRAAGWIPDVAASKRCYSPPIPTASIATDYFQAPQRSAGLPLADDDAEVAGGGMVTGHRGSEDTIGALGLSHEQKRRRRKEQLEEEDSSDLSDDSDDDDKRAAQQIKFSKMPVRERSRSSPSNDAGRQVGEEGPAVMVTSPSRPPTLETQGLRRGSLGAVETMKQRARRDTTTSSEMSSDAELDANHFKRRAHGRQGNKSVQLAERIQEEEDQDGDGGDSDLDDDDVGEASDLSDEFEGADASGSLLGLGIGVSDGMERSSPLKPPANMMPPITPLNSSPRKLGKESLPKLPKLPPGRPMSIAQPVSMLSKMLRGTAGSGEKPFQRYVELSGKDEASPLWIKIYAPFSEKSTKPFQVPIKRTKEGAPVTVAELIGLALWRYNEEDYQPPLSEQDANINRWTLRMVEDEEVDMDFPALVRTKPVTDFSSNNNRPPQRRMRDKPWDEFGLVRATEEQFKENEELTPELGVPSPAAPQLPTPRPELNRGLTGSTMQRTDSEGAPQGPPPSVIPNRNPITGPSFAPSALRKDSSNLLDIPQQAAVHSTPRTGTSKTVTVHFTDTSSFQTSIIALPTTSDTYIAELFDQACKRLNLDKALHVLKVRGTQTVAPADRTVEALGERLHLDLTRRRFAGGDTMFGLGLAGSPGSTSPNAPLLLTTGTTPTKKKKGFTLHPLATNTSKPSHQDITTHPAAPVSGTHVPLPPALTENAGKRYHVIRKQPLSFTSSHPRTLIISPEYMQILPATQETTGPPQGKVTNVHMSSVVGVKVSRKHPKMVRVLVYREKETKRYDFEASGREEAGSIVGEVRRGMARWGGEGGLMG